ncbi:hypothetical protein J4Q44_G00205940 [Coregonus suidteri]|uniref:Uncharacterized protein n=1 Tax=Coregonus suidteri TaxID=861788 RepID=A0AAN8LRY3_9TELE
MSYKAAAICNGEGQNGASDKQVDWGKIHCHRQDVGSHDGWLGIGGRSCPCPLHGLEADPGLGPLYQRQVQGQLESLLWLRIDYDLGMGMGGMLALSALAKVGCPDTPIIQGL